MKDVSVIVLTVGEDTLNSAIESINNQTLKPVETFIIRNITPFHNAINAGIRKVRTDYFLQVDSDFILDEKCIELLRLSMTPEVGVAIGQLRDPITGIESGVKLYRTECFANRKFINSISPETDILHEVIKDGWKVIYTLSNNNCNVKTNTLGKHNPIYTPLYTYLRFYRLGLKLAYRREAFYIKSCYEKLSKSKHKNSLIAKIAFSNGLFGSYDRNYLAPEYLDTDDNNFNLLQSFFSDNNKFITNGFDIKSINYLKPIDMFSKFMELGIWLRKYSSWLGFIYYLDIINICKSEYSWVGKAGLCHGLLLDDTKKEEVKAKFDILSDLI